MTLSDQSVKIRLKAEIVDEITISWRAILNDSGDFVPEKDRFEWSLGAGWCAVYQLVNSNSSTSEEISDKIVKTLTKYLRERDGIPGFQAMMAVIAEPPGHSISGSIAALNQIVSSEFGHRHTKVAAEEAKSLLTRKLASGGTLEPKNLARHFAARVCIALVEHYLFARVRLSLIADGKFTDLGEANQWQKQMEREIQPSIDKIAGQLLQKTDGDGLRAPRRISPKKSTSDLLTEELNCVVGSNPN